MIVPTEIIAYADDVNKLSAYYPQVIDNQDTLYFSWSGDLAVIGSDVWTTGGTMYKTLLDSSEAQILLDNTYSNYDWYPYIRYTTLDHTATVYECVIRSLDARNGSLSSPDNGDYSAAAGESKFGLAGYVLIDYGKYLTGDPSSSNTSNLKYFRLENYVSQSFDYSSSPVFFLYQFGQNIMAVSDTVYDFISYEIGGVSVLSVMFGSGFLLFAVWVIGKWVIP